MLTDSISDGRNMPEQCINVWNSSKCQSLSKETQASQTYSETQCRTRTMNEPRFKLTFVSCCWNCLRPALAYSILGWCDGLKFNKVRNCHCSQNSSFLWLGSGLQKFLIIQIRMKREWILTLRLSNSAKENLNNILCTYSRTNRLGSATACTIMEQQVIFVWPCRRIPLTSWAIGSFVILFVRMSICLYLQNPPVPNSGPLAKGTKFQPLKTKKPWKIIPQYPQSYRSKLWFRCCKCWCLLRAPNQRLKSIHEIPVWDEKIAKIGWKRAMRKPMQGRVKGEPWSQCQRIQFDRVHCVRPWFVTFTIPDKPRLSKLKVGKCPITHNYVFTRQITPFTQKNTFLGNAGFWRNG